MPGVGEGQCMKILVRMLNGGVWRMRYDQYLKTGVWRIFRARWITQHGDQVREVQGAGAMNCTTARLARIGQERDDDVVLLCRQCHDTFHGRHGMDVEQTDAFCRERVHFGHRIHGWKRDLEDWGERAMPTGQRNLVWRDGRWQCLDAGEPDVQTSSMKLVAAPE